MLFVALLKGFPATTQETRIRRMEWDYPDVGTKVLGEYWLQSNDPEVVAIFEADHISQIMATFAAWDDVFEVKIYPAVSADEGLELLKQMSQ